MEASFWHEKWDARQIGFHQDSVNPLLIKFWSALALPANSTVFVPLCGKSLDMCYLAEKGHEMLGCELNETAVSQFFSDNDLEHSLRCSAEHQQFATEQVTIFQGDIFALSAAMLADVGGFYDRAALVAWPEAMRLAYVELLAKLIPAKSIGLLITLDYPQEALKGPPFAVSDDWVTANMSADFDIELLESEDVLLDHPRFVKKQVPWLTESVYRLVKKG